VPIQIRRTVMREGGEAAWEALLARLSPEARAAVGEGVGLHDWVPVALATELSQAWLDQVPPRVRGRVVADEQLAAAHRWLELLTTPEQVLRQADMIHHHYYRGGRVEIEAAPGAAEVRIWALGLYPAWFTDLFPGYAQRLLEICGGRDVIVAHTPPKAEDADPWVHRYRVTWSQD
jgi:hypothetical protein